MRFCSKLESGKGVGFVALLLGLILASGLAVADTLPRDHQITAEDYFDLTVLGNISVSPDGRWAAYSESRWGEGKEGRSTDLWAIRTDGKDMHRLTFDGFGAGRPQWNPASDTIYFLGHQQGDAEKPPHDGSTQVWRVDEAHGLVAVTRHEGGVRDFQLDPSGRYLYYKVDDEVTDDPWADLKKENSDLEFGHGVRTLHALRRLDLKTWRDEEVFAADRVIWEMSLSPSGRGMAMITTEDNELIFKEGWSNIEILDLESGAVATVTSQAWRDSHESPYGWLENLAWSADSRALAFAIAYDGYAPNIWVTEWRDDAWQLDLVQRPDMVTYSGGLRWQGGGRTLCFQGESLARVGVYGIENVKDGRQGGSRILVGGDVVVGGFDFDARGKKLLAGLETTTTANDLYLIKGQTKHERLTHLNPQVDTWILPQIKHVSWTGADGDPCYGILELPHGYQEGDGPLPTIIELHGGPTSSTKYRLRLWIYGRALMASNGYALLSPNYHGSTGYGDAFLEKLIGRENEIEVKDIAAGTQWLIDQGIADPERIGVMGWSNGGYLTNCMITGHPDLYRAASSGAGVLDMVIQWGIEDTPGHVINFMEGLPWEQADHYRDASPLFDLNRVRTPTLIHVGSDDPRVPAAHARALYRALRHYLNVPVELVVYPGEGHGLSTYENRLAKMEWDLAWFGRHLLGEENGDEE